MYESRGNAHSGLSLIHLGLALRLMGDEKRGNAAIAEGIKKPRVDGYWWGDYGSPLRDAALSYALLNRHKVKAEGMDGLLVLAANEMSRNRYYSTQEKLALFLAGREFTRAESETWTATLTLGGKEQTISTSGSLIQEVSRGDTASGLRLKNTSKDKLFAELSISGHPARTPPAKSDLIALTRTLYDADGNLLPSRPLKVGETVIVHLKASTHYRIPNGMVVDKIPAGLEIENLNIVQGEGLGAVTIGKMNPAEVMADRRIQHVEFRDDRFVAAVRLEGDTHLFYRAKVVTPGRFVVPPVYAEDMYRPDVYGLAGGETTLVVTDGKSQ